MKVLTGDKRLAAIDEVLREIAAMDGHPNVGRDCPLCLKVSVARNLVANGTPFPTDRLEEKADYRTPACSCIRCAPCCGQCECTSCKSRHPILWMNGLRGDA